MTWLSNIIVHSDTFRKTWSYQTRMSGRPLSQPQEGYRSQKHEPKALFNIIMGHDHEQQQGYHPLITHHKERKQPFPEFSILLNFTLLHPTSKKVLILSYHMIALRPNFYNTNWSSYLPLCLLRGIAVNANSYIWIRGPEFNQRPWQSVTSLPRCCLSFPLW